MFMLKSLIFTTFENRKLQKASYRSISTYTLFQYEFNRKGNNYIKEIHSIVVEPKNEFHESTVF